MSQSPAASPRPRSGTASSIQSATRSVRSASGRFMESEMPLGMWAAAATATSMAPTMSDIRRGSFGAEGWNADQHRDRSGSGPEESQQQTQPQSGRRPSSAVLGRSMMRPSAPVIEEGSTAEPFPDMSTPQRETVPEMSSSTEDSASSPKYSHEAHKSPKVDQINLASSNATSSGEPTPAQLKLAKTKSYPNGYIVPPKVPWTKSTMIGFIAFMKWFITPFGFLVTLYGLNVVAWGGMLFLLLLGAAPAMCSQNAPSNNFNGCNDINSPRRIWIEIDSQILNALFCVTGFGLVPWRFRDLYWLLRWRFTSEKRKGRAAKMYPLRRLAGIHAGWVRLPGSDTIDEQSGQQWLASNGKSDGIEMSQEKHAYAEAGVEAGADDERLPLPLSKTPAAPLTGVRAQPTKLWILDFVIWCNVWNTFFQTCLCGFMWGLNRYDRPSWSTGLFVALACIIAAVGGIVMFVQGKRVKRVEGVAPDGSNGGAEAIGVAGEENAKK